MLEVGHSMEGGHTEGSCSQTVTVSSVTFRGILPSKVREIMDLFIFILKKEEVFYIFWRHADT